MTDIRIKVVGDKARFALVRAENDQGQDLLDMLFDPLAEYFHRGDLIIDLQRAALLCSIAQGLRLGVTLDIQSAPRSNKFVWCENDIRFDDEPKPKLSLAR